MQNKIILGIDPGYGRCGWGVIHVQGSESTCIDYGCIETPKEEELPTRLAILHQELTKIVDKHKPDAVAIEELFFAKNVTTALGVAHARGIIMLCAVHHTGKIFQYKPAQVKQATTGIGNADKKQVIEMVRIILGMEVAPKSDDAADALAVAICHSAFSRG